jgi:MGT family glycosyltransferase
MERAALVLHATDRAFDYSFDNLPRHHRYIGPLFWEQPGPLPDYLQAPGEAWMVCTLSSLAQDDTPIARAAMRAVEHTSSRLLVTVGPGHSPGEVAPIPPNVRVEQYVPQSPVLQRSKALVSHAGHGSVMKALRYAVPMVLVPWSRDQFGVAARAESIGAALIIPKEQLSAEAMSSALSRVLGDPRYLWAAERAAGRLKNHPPDNEAVGQINALLGVGLDT